MMNPQTRDLANRAGDNAAPATVFDDIGLGVIVTDPRGTVSFANGKAAQLLGMPRDRLVGANLNSLRRERFSHLFSSYFERAISTGQPVKFEDMPPPPPPPENVSRLRYSLYPRASGAVITVEDVSAEWRASESLRTAALSINVLRDAIFFVQGVGYVFHSNETASRITGYGREDLKGMTIWQLLPDLDIGMLRGMGEAPDSDSAEMTMRSKGGTTLPVEVYVTRKTFFNLEQYVVAARDITERKRSESERELLHRQLAGSQQRLEAVIASMPAGVLIAEAPSAKIILGNRQCEKILGHPYIACDRVEDYVGYKGFHTDGTRVRPREWPLVRSATEGEVVAGEEIVYQRGDDTKCCLLFYSSPIRDEKGRVVAAVATFLDITRRKRDERELAEAKAQAELYVDLMGHDINNMHQIALGYLELALELIPTDGNQREMLEKPVEVLERSARLIQNVRKLQRSQSGEYQRETYDLGAVIEEVAAQYQEVPGRYVKITSGTVNGVFVQADELLKDVFANLIGNAIKHSTGPTFVNVRMNRENEDGRPYCRVTVEDNGPGVPDAMKERIFGRLSRGDTKAKGSGLGLHLVRSLVESYGGKVWVEDRVKGDPAKGARFVVLLPVAQSP